MGNQFMEAKLLNGDYECAVNIENPTQTKRERLEVTAVILHSHRHMLNAICHFEAIVLG